MLVGALCGLQAVRQCSRRSWLIKQRENLLLLLQGNCTCIVLYCSVQFSIDLLELYCLCVSVLYYLEIHIIWWWSILKSAFSFTKVIRFCLLQRLTYIQAIKFLDSAVKLVSVIQLTIVVIFFFYHWYECKSFITRITWVIGLFLSALTLKASDVIELFCLPELIVMSYVSQPCNLNCK